MGRFDELIGSLEEKFGAVTPYLDERQRRTLYAAEARQLGHGGIAAVARAVGVSKGCVSRGLAELDAGRAPDGRVRRPGAAARHCRRRTRAWFRPCWRWSRTARRATR